MTGFIPDARLRSAADFVRQGACLADVGCDHAILPVWLCGQGKVRYAYACDIAAGPCERARAAVSRAGLSDRIRVVQTDGLKGLEGCGITDVSICGMGGELIARIILEACFVRDPAVRLILGPMSKPAALRRYLAENGFAVTAETISEVSGKLYFCLCASFDGRARALSPFAAEFGEHLPSVTPVSPLFLRYLAQKKASLLRRCRGLAQAGLPHEGEDALAEEIERFIHDRT